MSTQIVFSGTQSANGCIMSKEISYEIFNHLKGSCSSRFHNTIWSHIVIKISTYGIILIKSMMIARMSGCTLCTNFDVAPRLLI